LYPALLAFAVLFAFMIYPWGIMPYYMLIKSQYLTGFLVLWWLIFLWQWVRSGFVFGRIRPADWAALAFIALVWLSAFLSSDFYTSLFGNLTRAEGLLAIVAYVSLYFFASRYIPPHRYTTVLWAMTLSSALVSIYGILQHFLLDFLPRSPLIGKGTRSFGFFDNPNFFGSYLVIMIAISAALYLMSLTKWQKSASLTITTIHFVALIYSQTRSAWLGALAVGGFFTLLLIMKYRYLWKRWILLVVVLGIIFTVVNHFEHGAISNRANSIVSSTKGALAGNGFAGASRWYIWQKTMPLIPKYFWHGSGPDTFANVFPKNKAEYAKYLGNENMVVDKVHNEYLQIAVTMGIPALLTYLTLTGIILLSGWRICHGVASPPAASGQAPRTAANPLDSDRRGLVQAGLLAVVIGYMVQSFFNISIVSVAPFFWMVLGLCYGGSKDGTQYPRP
jgi:putative inorganic carbon (HCO3(-)) transporter